MEITVVIKRQRFCLFCHQVGITENFETGNALRQHVRQRHPRTPAQKTKDKNRLRVYRRDVLLLAQASLGVRPK